MTWSRRTVKLRPARRQPPAVSSRPRLEQLEDRSLPSTLTVTTLADGLGSFNPQTHTDTTLRGAISNAAPGDTIRFVTGLQGTVALDAELGTLQISKNLTIAGPGAGVVAVSGGDQVEVFRIASQTRVAISGLTIEHGQATVINGNGAIGGGGIANFGTLSLSNSIVRNNQASAPSTASKFETAGGGMYNAGSLTLNHSSVTDNQAGTNAVLAFGGGLFNDNGTVTIRGGTVSGNQLVAGQGIDLGAGIASTGALTIVQGTIARNTAVSQLVAAGGGIANFGGLSTRAVVISGNQVSAPASQRFPGGDGGGVYSQGTWGGIDDSFLHNTASTQGGGVDNEGAATLRNSTLAFNHDTGGVGGGGVFNRGPLTLLNCTVADNSAATGSNGGGGGILDASRGGGLEAAQQTASSLALVNCTVAGNSVTGGSGGGIRQSAGATVHLENTIVATNRAPTAPDLDATLDATSNHNLIGIGNPAQDGGHGNLVGTAAHPLNPELGPLANNGGPTLTMALAADSPAIDHGNDDVLGPPFDLKTDQRDQPRKSGAHVDIGAYEYQQSALPIPGRRNG
jgi:hypothetical protein